MSSGLLHVLALLLLASLVIQVYSTAQRLVEERLEQPGAIYRLLHPLHHREPNARICKCGHKHPPMCVTCDSDDHPADVKSFELDHPDEENGSRPTSGPGQWLRDEQTRLWGVRLLGGLVLLAALWTSAAPPIYVALALTAAWILLPMLLCHPSGLAWYLGLAVVAFGTVGALLYLPIQGWRHGLSSSSFVFTYALPVSSNSPVVSFGSISPAAILVHGIGVLAAMLAVILGYRSYRYQSTGASMTFAVFSMSVLVSALALLSLGLLQNFSFVVSPYVAVLVLSLGWLTGAFLQQAIVLGLIRLKQDLRKRALTIGPYVGSDVPSREARHVDATKVFHGFPEVPHWTDIDRPEPVRADTSLERTLFGAARVVQSLAVLTTNRLLRAIVTLSNAIIHGADVVVAEILAVVNRITEALVWMAHFAEYSCRGFRELVRLRSVGVFVAATAGFRPVLVAPLLLLGAAVALALTAQAAAGYLATGSLWLMVVALGSLCYAGMLLILAASVFFMWDIARAIGAVMPDYLGQALFCFAIYLDFYGLGRHVLGLPSHYGLLSWGLNLLLVGLIATTILRRRVAPARPVRPRAALVSPITYTPPSAATLSLVGVVVAAGAALLLRLNALSMGTDPLAGLAVVAAPAEALSDLGARVGVAALVALAVATVLMALVFLAPGAMSVPLEPMVTAGAVPLVPVSIVGNQSTSWVAVSPFAEPTYGSEKSEFDPVARPEIVPGA